MLLIISINEKGEVCIYIDSAHVIHSDGRGHSSLYLTIDQGGIISVSKKFRFVTTSSIETGVVTDRERFLKCA